MIKIKIFEIIDKSKEFINNVLDLLVKKHNLKLSDKKIIIIFVFCIFVLIFSMYKFASNNLKINEENFTTNSQIIEEKKLEDSEKSEFKNANLETIENSENSISDEKIIVHIDGMVKNPGIYQLPVGSRLSLAIEKAGGLKEEADTKNVNLAMFLKDGMKIYIPVYDIFGSDEAFFETEEGIEKYNELNNNVKNDKSANKGGLIDVNSSVNINLAGKKELMQIKGIGDKMAERIIEYRKQNGKFKSIEEIKKVKGIGNKKYEDIKRYINVGK